MSYKKVLERIEAMPVKRLIAYAYSRNGDVCAIGAAVLHPEELQSMSLYPDSGGGIAVADIEALAETNRTVLGMILETGMTVEEAHDLQTTNDGVFTETEKEKYVRVHRRLKAVVEDEEENARNACNAQNSQNSQSEQS